MASTFYNVLVGSENGLLKGIYTEARKWDNLNEVTELNRDKEITAICWGNSAETQALIGHRNRVIDVYDVEDNAVTLSLPLPDGSGSLRGLDTVGKSILTCTESGHLRAWNTVTLEEEDRTQLEPTVEISAGENIYAMEKNPHQSNLVATGGKENDLKLWDLQKPEEAVFKAKNVRNDWLNLRVPVWVTGIGFMPDGKRIVTSTGHHQVRIYDPNIAQRRPVFDLEFDEYPLTAMSVRPNGNHVVVGNTRGNMALLDLRGKGHVVRCYKGFAGGVRSVRFHPSKDLVLSCGLDRFLRVHDVENPTPLVKMYLKSRLNVMLLASRWQDETSRDQHIQEDGAADAAIDAEAQLEDASNDEDADLWDSFKVIGGEKRKLKDDASELRESKSRDKANKKTRKQRKLKVEKEENGSDSENNSREPVSDVGLGSAGLSGDSDVVLGEELSDSDEDVEVVTKMKSSAKKNKKPQTGKRKGTRQTQRTRRKASV